MVLVLKKPKPAYIVLQVSQGKLFETKRPRRDKIWQWDFVVHIGKGKGRNVVTEKSHSLYCPLVQSQKQDDAVVFLLFFDKSLPTSNVGVRCHSPHYLCRYLFTQLQTDCLFLKTSTSLFYRLSYQPRKFSLLNFLSLFFFLEPVTVNSLWAFIHFLF